MTRKDREGKGAIDRVGTRVSSGSEKQRAIHDAYHILELDANR